MSKYLYCKIAIRIAHNEIRTAFREGRILFLTITSWLLFISSLYVGFVYYETVSKDRIESQRRVRELWLGQEEKNPHAAGHYGTYAFKPLSIFNLMEKGIDPYTGQAIRIETHKQNSPEIRTAEDSTFLLRSGELTIGFAFLYIIPLLIIVVAHGMISREREQGTLKLAICQGLTKIQLLCGKLLGAIAILSVVIFPVIVGLVWVVFQHTGGEETFFSSIILLSGYSAYFLIFLFVSVTVSAIYETSRKSLLVLFSFWITVCVIIPKVSGFISEQIYLTPSAYDFTEDIEKETLQGGYEGVAHWRELNEKAEKELMAEYGISNSDSLPVSVFGYALQILENEGHAAYERNYKKIDSLFVNQNRVHSYLSVLSPFMNMRFVSMGISGSDVWEYFHFIDFSEIYRRKMMGILNEDIMEHQKKGQKNMDYKGNYKLWEKVPDFIYKPRDLQERLMGYSLNLQFLIFWLALSLLVMGFSFRRLKL